MHSEGNMRAVFASEERNLQEDPSNLFAVFFLPNEWESMSGWAYKRGKSESSCIQIVGKKQVVVFVCKNESGSEL